MTPLNKARAMALAAYDAPTPLAKLRAIEVAIDALEVAIGTPGDEMNKAAGSLRSLQGKLGSLEASIANIEELDRRRSAKHPVTVIKIRKEFHR